MSEQKYILVAYKSELSSYNNEITLGSDFIFKKDLLLSELCKELVILFEYNTSKKYYDNHNYEIEIIPELNFENEEIKSELEKAEKELKFNREEYANELKRRIKIRYNKILKELENAE